MYEIRNHTKEQNRGTDDGDFGTAATNFRIECTCAICGIFIDNFVLNTNITNGAGRHKVWCQ